MDHANAKALHATSFGAATQAYERGRPSYPAGASAGCCRTAPGRSSTSEPGPAS